MVLAATGSMDQADAPPNDQNILLQILKIACPTSGYLGGFKQDVTIMELVKL
jgi:hypothetical protein